MSEIYDFDPVAANNNAAPPDGFPENMNYQQVNDSARELMAVVARYIAANGATLTTGTNNDYLLTVSQTISAYASGMVFAFKANRASITGAATLNINSVGTAPLVNNDSTALATAGDIKINAIVAVMYDGTSFVMLNPSGNSITQAEGDTHYLRQDGTSAASANIPLANGINVTTLATFNTGITNTGVLTQNGAATITGVLTTASGSPVFKGSLGNDPATNPGGSQDSQLLGQNSSAESTFLLGHDTGVNFDISNLVHGGDINLKVQQDDGTQKTPLAISAEEDITVSGRLITSLQPPAFRGTLNNDPNANPGGAQDSFIVGQNSGGTETFRIGHTSSTIMEYRNRVQGGRMDFITESDSGTAVTAFSMDPEGVGFFRNPGTGTNAFRTATGADGGLEVYNGYTGDSSAQRVLTTADLKQVRRTQLGQTVSCDGVARVMSAPTGNSQSWEFDLLGAQAYVFRAVFHARISAGAAGAVLGLAMRFSGTSDRAFFSANNNNSGFSEARKDFDATEALRPTGVLSIGTEGRQATIDGYIRTTSAGTLRFYWGSSGSFPGNSFFLAAGSFCELELATVQN